MKKFFRQIQKPTQYAAIVLLWSVVGLLISCSTQTNKPSLDARVEKLKQDFEQGYTSRVENEAKSLIGLLPKGSSTRVTVMELYAKALTQNGKLVEAGKVYSQMVDENPLSDKRREWLKQSAKNFLESRSRSNVDPKPLTLAMDQLNRIISLFRSLNEEETELMRRVIERLREYYVEVARFYRAQGRGAAAEVYERKASNLTVNYGG